MRRFLSASDSLSSDNRKGRIPMAFARETSIQALDRLVPLLPLSPGRAERHGFKYYRHGTLSLYAAFNTKTGEVFGQNHYTAQQ